MNKIKIFIGTAGILPFAGASILLWALQLHACFGLSFDKCDGVLSILKYFLPFTLSPWGSLTTTHSLY